MCVTFVVFTDCENCTRPISTRLTHGACFVARRLELVGVAGLMWVSWCVLGGADFFVFFSDFFFLRTHAAYCKYEAASCLIYLSTIAGSIHRQGGLRNYGVDGGVYCSVVYECLFSRDVHGSSSVALARLCQVSQRAAAGEIQRDIIRYYVLTLFTVDRIGLIARRLVQSPC